MTHPYRIARASSSLLLCTVKNRMSQLFYCMCRIAPQEPIILCYCTEWSRADMYRMESTPRDRNHHELNSSALCCNKPSCVGRGRGRQRTGPEALTTTFLFSKIGFGLEKFRNVNKIRKKKILKIINGLATQNPQNYQNTKNKSSYKSRRSVGQLDGRDQAVGRVVA